MKKILCVLLISLFVLAVLPAEIVGWTTPAKAAEPTIIQIAAGGHHTLVLFSDSSLYAWGYNWAGQVGDGTNTNKKTPVKIGTGFTAISAGVYHSLALKGNDLYAWGNNQYGQLGDGTKTDKNTPVHIGTGFTTIAAGFTHSLALKGNNLYAWGANESGQLCDGTNTSKNIPVQIGTGYTAIATQYHHSLALKGNTLYTWGTISVIHISNRTSGSNNSRNTLMRIETGLSTIAARYNYYSPNKRNTLSTPPLRIYKNTPVQIGTGYTAISAGCYHSLALKGNTLYAWGWNGYGQLGDGTNIDKNTPIPIEAGYTAIAGGYTHSLALKGDALYAWGSNDLGKLVVCKGYNFGYKRFSLMRASLVVNCQSTDNFAEFLAQVHA